MQAVVFNQSQSCPKNVANAVQFGWQTGFAERFNNLIQG
jgi:hypothetical protein